MRSGRPLVFFLALAAMLGARHGVATAELITERLPNGLEVLLVEDHKAPVVTVQIFYRAGSKDEPGDRRGIAHLFEHMMFKGSRHVPPEEHARFIDAVGGESNAFTTDDVTAYHETIPPFALDFALQLEAERMRDLMLTQPTIDSEREVVKEELRVRIENNPVMQALDKVLRLAYRVHPYQQLTIGRKEMLDAITLDDCRRFYDAFYQPANALVVVVGDVTRAQVMRSVAAHFGSLPRVAPPARTIPAEPSQIETRTASVKLPVRLPVVIGAYHVPKASHLDLYALEVLQQILSGGDSSRLYQRLVRRDRLAVAAGGFLFARQDPGLFVTYGAFLPNQDAARVGAALQDENARLAREPVSPRELQKARNQLAAQAVYRTERVTELGTQIGSDAIVAGDPSRAFSASARYDAVTALDVQRVARSYLTPSNLSVVTLENAP